MPMDYWKPPRIKDFMTRVETRDVNSSMSENYLTMKPASYEKPDLNQVVSSLEHLDEMQKNQLLKVLTNNEASLQGIKGHWVGEDVKIELLSGGSPYFAKPYTTCQSCKRN